MTSSAVLSPGLNGGVAGVGSPSTRPPNQDTGKLNSRSTVHGLTPRKPTMMSSETASSASPAPSSYTSKKATGGGSAVCGGGGGPRQTGSSGGAHGSKPDLVSRLTDADGPLFVPECVRLFTYSLFCGGSDLKFLSDVNNELCLHRSSFLVYPRHEFFLLWASLGKGGLFPTLREQRGRRNSTVLSLCIVPVMGPTLSAFLRDICARREHADDKRRMRRKLLSVI